MIKIKLLKEPKMPKKGSLETFKKFLSKHHAIEKENEKRIKEHNEILKKLEGIKKTYGTKKKNSKKTHSKKK